MATTTLIKPFETIAGSMHKGDGVVHRRKMYRDASGKVLHMAKQESYKVANPRNYDKTPPKGEELGNINRFHDAALRTTQILHAQELLEKAQTSGNAEEITAAETLLQQLNDFRARYEAQLQRPDQSAPIDRKTGHRKQYWSLNTFIRAMIYLDLKNS